MAESWKDPWKSGRKGLEILADIMQHMEPASAGRLLGNLKRELPKAAAFIEQNLFTFDRLAYCDQRGIRLLLSRISMRDLAIALKGAPQEVLTHLAENMSKQAIQMLEDEIRNLRPSRSSEIELARSRIVTVAKDLVSKHQMYVTNSADRLVS